MVNLFITLHIKGSKFFVSIRSIKESTVRVFIDSVPYRTREYGVPYRTLVPYSCLVITNEQIYFNPKQRFTTQIKPVIRNPGYNEKKLPSLKLFVIAEYLK
jgi:hypothetical protein